MTSTNKRIASIDVARGLVMVLMTVDHVRETFFMQHQVSDPMDVAATSPALFFTRVTAHFCAPMFVFLTGLSAWLYAHPAGGQRNASSFLVKRGIFLIGLEITVINFAWTGSLTPSILYLQVIWAIGLAMLVLALLHRLPRAVLAILGVAIVGGHNALAGVSFEPGTAASAAWAILEQRGFLSVDPVPVKISYPSLAWIGVILLGYVCGPLFARATPATDRQRWLVIAGAACLVLMVLLRTANVYGEPLPWSQQGDLVHSTMSFVNFTKYPPSLGFLLLTLGCGLLVLAWLEHRDTAFTRVAAVFGSAPLFYYVLHLYALLALQRVAAIAFGLPRVDVAHVWQLWTIAILIAMALYWLTKKFGMYKRSSNRTWVKYM